MAWSKSQRNIVIAAYLGWTLDAFDFFLMVFMFKDISAELHSSMQVVSSAVLLTLGMRPVGAFLSAVSPTASAASPRSSGTSSPTRSSKWHRVLLRA